KEFTIGGEVENVSGAIAPIPHYQRAIALDALFARAYSSLAMEYSDAGESSLAATHATKAYGLRDRCTPAEKYLIEAAYHSSVSGNLAKVAEAYQLLATYRPRAS